MIRVLQLLTATSPGGGPRQVYQLARRLPRDEFDVTLAGPPNALFQKHLDALGIELVPIALDALRGLPWTLAATRSLIRRSGADVVHTHGKGAGFYGRLAAWPARVPAVHTFHGIHYEGYSDLGRRAYLLLERGLARRTRTVINVSAAQEAEAVALGLAPAGRRAVVVNGVDVEELDAAPAWDRATHFGRRDVVVLGCVARFDPVKRHAVLLRAVRRVARAHPNVRLLLVGGGPEADRIRTLATELALSPGPVVFAGAAGWGTSPYGAMDLYVTASAKEGLPLAPLEAMASRLPVVASDVPGHRDVVAHGETGVLVPPDDDGALAAAIEDLVGAPERRTRMGRAGRERVLREFAIGPMVARTAEIYRAAVRPAPPR